MIVFPELRYCFYGITGIDACESRGYQIQVRHSSGRVRTGGGYRLYGGKSHPALNRGGSYDTKARPGLVRITKILMSECQSKTLKPDALSDRSRPQGCRRLHFMALKIRLSCRYTAHVCASNRLSHNIQGKAMRVIFRKS